METAAFYGTLDSREAQYPGLDYSYQPHRRRLSRFTWHRRLFRAFDNLKLTKSEIAGLTKWEGTRWAKERFEKEQGITIRDTTGDGIEDWVDPQFRGNKYGTQATQPRHDVAMEDIEEDRDTEGTYDVDEDSDMDIGESVGIDLNERLIAAAAERDAGNSTTIMDAEWEQWLKDAAEAGGIPFIADRAIEIANLNQGEDSTHMPPRLLNAARLGQWHQIPDFLHTIVRENIEANNRRVNDLSSGISTNTPRRTPPIVYQARSTVTRTAAPPHRILRQAAAPVIHNFNYPPSHEARADFSNMLSRQPPLQPRSAQPRS